MSGLDFEDQVPAPRYTPSGWFNVLTLWPLLGVGIVISLAMAAVLLLLEENLYFYFFTPLVVGMPVFAATWGVIRFSHCRNPLVGTLVGLTLAALYYAGYWELSYRVNVVANGPFAVAMVRQIGGAPGLPGYINFRCKTSKPIHHPGGGAGAARPPNKADHVFNGIFFGGEALLLAGIAVAIGRGWSQRVYFEPQRRWASRFEFRLPPSTLPAVLAAVEARSWSSIAALPRVSSVGNANTASLLFRVEYLPGGADSPAYVTVSGTNLPKDLRAPAGVPKPRRGAYLNQVAIEAESAQMLSRHFPDIRIAAPSPQPSKTEMDLAPLTPVGGAFDPLADGTVLKKKSGDRASQADFRDRAVEATRELLDEEEEAEPWAVDSACCLPTGMGPRQVRSAAWWKLKALGATFALFFASLGLAAWAEDIRDARGQRTAMAQALVYIGATGAVVDGCLMLWMCFGSDAVQKRLLIRRLGRRPGSLLRAGAHLPSKLLRLEDAETYHVQKLSPEDVCVCAFDVPNRRVLMEGISHRYIIRAEDVTNFWPLQSGDKVSIRIDYLINDVPLNLVMAADNPLAHVFHGVFAHRSLKRLVARFVETFGREFPDAGPPVSSRVPA